MKKALVTVFVGFFLLVFAPASAWAEELILGGEAVGIQIHTEGVLVADLAQIETAQGTVCPAEEAGIQKGDFIIEIDGQKLSSATELVEKVNERAGKDVELKLMRKDESFTCSMEPVQSAENQWMLGMWLRDGVSGVGTITYKDPEDGSFGALGHSVSDADSGTVLPISEGSISDAEIINVKKGAAGAPGELNGCADVYKLLGTVEKNTVYGIFGTMNEPVKGKIVETGEPVVGKASILSTVQGRESKEYSVEISRISRDGGTNHMVITVTDPELLSLTGGIVQGMSGSPIIQDGKLVGAVTHVCVNP